MSGPGSERAFLAGAQSLGALRARLLRWFQRHRRPLPWRRDADPYRVWLSEIMLQQTRVAAVLEHYENFLRRFPRVEKLARARPATVLAAWSGLGYYRRAHSLHQAARQIVYARGGHFPQTSEQWRQLPGIGRYTAAAIASIAFVEPSAVVDGNVRRVLERMVAARARQRAGQDWWALAQKLLSRAHPGDFNQAMMELGATICLPAQPRCEHCPIASWCESSSMGEAARLSRPRGPHRIQREVTYLLVVDSQKLYLVQRPEAAALMPGMWELPAANGDFGEAIFKLRHAITNTDYRVTVLRGCAEHARGGQWATPARAARLPLTGLARKILRRSGII